MLPTDGGELSSVTQTSAASTSLPTKSRTRMDRVFSPGDELRVTCRWDNSDAHQPLIDGVRKKTVDVKWGEGTADEMCVGNLFISELE